MKEQNLQAPYTVKSLQDLLGISRRTLLQMTQAGFVAPVVGPRGEYRFTFQDVVLLRTACGLRAAQVPTPRILRALKKIREQLPADVPLTGLRIAATGRDVTVRDGTSHWEADTGQLLIDFHVEPAGASVAIFPTCKDEAAPADDDPQAWFDRALLDEERDPAAAEAAYRHALRLDPAFADAYLNLGALLCELKRCGDAVDLYDQALQHCQREPLIHFNRAIALEDAGLLDRAIESYRQCVVLDPKVADAHYNLSGLLQQRGEVQAALRHFNAYRKLTGQAGTALGPDGAK